MRSLTIWPETIISGVIMVPVSMRPRRMVARPGRVTLVSWERKLVS